MSGIKTLADELRQRIRDHDATLAESGTISHNGVKSKDQTKVSPIQLESNSVEPSPEKIPPKRSRKKDNTDELLEQIKAFPNKGSEKLLIRLDGRDVQLLKQLKLVSGIDMIQVIAFSLDNFLKSNPGLKEYIKQSLLNEFK
ncbi:hypothetical protein ACS126_03185 [Sphingobacterium lactis]|uniref:hypothetical protein n=1 Tax=Sphingobacterium TaxID=28453 RepID=UPI0021A67C18|nr:hypothetical protein [Sphingobacterium hotanense]MCT1525843.1 hypothetical protein [Sphingobacterium hotanense]